MDSVTFTKKPSIERSDRLIAKTKKTKTKRTTLAQALAKIERRDDTLKIYRRMNEMRIETFRENQEEIAHLKKTVAFLKEIERTRLEEEKIRLEKKIAQLLKICDEEEDCLGKHLVEQEIIIVD